MIEICEECGQKFRLNSAVRERGRAQFRCKTCGHVITISSRKSKNVEEALVEETLEDAVTRGWMEPADASDDPAAPRAQADSVAAQPPETIGPQGSKPRGMGLRSKMMLLFALVPILIYISSGYYFIQQMNELANLMITGSGQAVTRMGEERIKDMARHVAKQCKQYMDAHPEVSIEDLVKDPEFRAIAVQKVGNKGYSAFHRIGPMVNLVHPVPKVEGHEVSKAVEKALGKDFHHFKNIVQPIDDGRNVETWGYYPWPDADGVVRDKFMVLAPVPGTDYGIAATIYLKEFVVPIEEVKRNSSAITASVGNSLLMILAAAVVLIGLIVTVYGNSLSGKIKLIASHAERISVGDLDSDLRVASSDEIGLLADAIARMQDSIRLSVKRLRKRRA